MSNSFNEVPEIRLHLQRLSDAQVKELGEFAQLNHWELKDFHQISQDLEEFILSRSPSESENSELYYLLAKILFFAGNLDKLNELFTLTAAIQNIPGVQLYYALGLAFQGHSKEGLEILEQIELNLNNEDYIIKLETLGAILYIYSIKRDYLTVSEYFYQIYNYFDQHDELSDEIKAHLLCTAYLRHAYCVRSQGKIYKAMELIEKSYRDLQKFPHRFFQVMALTLIGHCHHNLGNIQKALEFYDQAIDLAIDIQSWTLLSILYNRVGMGMMANKKQNLAKKYYHKAVDEATNAGANWLTIGPLANLAQWKLAEGKIKEAIDDYYQFVEVAAGVGDERELCYAQLTLAELFRRVGDIPKSKYFLSEGFKRAIKLGIFRTFSRSEDEVDYN
ncbi:MAG: hypothetical protein ACXAC8_14935 [Candidatus Hodarchaeales archaeon]|jgi:tetratricopeptide (TPR) repeat protein